MNSLKNGKVPGTQLLNVVLGCPTFKLWAGIRVTLLNFWVPGSQYDLMLLCIPEDVILQSHDYILLNADNAEIPWQTNRSTYTKMSYCA